MGTFHVACEIRSHVDRSRVARVPKMLVDTGSEHTWVSEALLRKLRIGVEKKDLTFVMAKGQTITRRVGFAILEVEGVRTTDEVVFAEEGDLQLLGARTLEGLNLRVDSRSKKLVARGPLPAAQARAERVLEAPLCDGAGHGSRGSVCGDSLGPADWCGPTSQRRSASLRSPG